MKNNKINNLNIDFTKPRKNEKLKPWQVTGLVDAEGGFFLNISKTDKGLIGFNIKLEFKVTQKNHSEGILHEIKEFFSCGNVVIDNRKTNTKKFQISALTDILNVILPHFDKYPCLTSKFINYKDWKKIALIMSMKEHLTKTGMQKILNIWSNMNTKRSFEDKYNFCIRSLLMNINNNHFLELSPYWVQAFLNGEGMFYNYIAEKKSRNKIYQGCDSSVEIAQNSHDVAVLLSIKQFFNAGYIKPKYDFFNLSECLKSRSINRYILRDTKIIIDFVDQYPMLTRKHLDYLDWKKIVKLKIDGAHKTEEGLALMKKILSNMNSKRDSDHIE